MHCSLKQYGDSVGGSDGDKLGGSVGRVVGKLVGDTDGTSEGDTLGCIVHDPHSTAQLCRIDVDGDEKRRKTAAGMSEKRSGHNTYSRRPPLIVITYLQGQELMRLNGPKRLKAWEWGQFCRQVWTPMAHKLGMIFQ